MAKFKRATKVSTSENKKIKGAVQIEYKGMVFRSKSELECYMILEASGLKFGYEDTTFNIIEPKRTDLLYVYESRPSVKAGKTKSGKCKRIFSLYKSSKQPESTYTPDFTIRSNDDKVIVYVEFKGFENDIFPTKKKLFFMKLQEMMELDNSIEYRYAYIKSISEFNEFIKFINDDPSFSNHEEKLF